MLFKPVRPVLVKRCLKYLKNYNYLYSGIEINMDNLTIDLLNLSNGLIDDNSADDDSSSSSNMY